MAASMPWIQRLRKRPLYVAFVLVAVAIAAWSFRPRAQLVDVARVERAPVTVAFVEEGRTRLRDRFMVSAPVAGVLERIDLEPGDPVTAGATVARIRPTRAALLDPMAREEAQARWRSALDAREAAAAALTAARAVERERQAAYARASRLGRDRLVARGDLDALAAAAEAARAETRAAGARLAAADTQARTARAVLDLQGADANRATHIALAAPIDGRVVRRIVESEAPVLPGQPLLEVGDVRQLEIVVDVLTSDAVRLAPGTPVELQHWGGAGTLAARVARIEPGAFTKVSALGVEEQRVPVVLHFAGPVPEQMGDGFRVDARFVVWRAAVPSVPIAALFRDGTRWAVYAIDGKRARLRHVDVGRVGEERAELLRGLDRGTTVIVHPGDGIRDGSRVEPAAR